MAEVHAACERLNSKTSASGPENCLLLTVAQAGFHFISKKGSETQEEKFCSKITFSGSDICNHPK